jgi:hypothetical protein
VLARDVRRRGSVVKYFSPLVGYEDWDSISSLQLDWDQVATTGYIYIGCLIQQIEDQASGVRPNPSPDLTTVMSPACR